MEKSHTKREKTHNTSNTIFWQEPVISQGKCNIWLELCFIFQGMNTGHCWQPFICLPQAGGWVGRWEWSRGRHRGHMTNIGWTLTQGEKETWGRVWINSPTFALPRSAQYSLSLSLPPSLSLVLSLSNKRKRGTKEQELIMEKECQMWH